MPRNQAGFYIAGCRRQGILPLPPDINGSKGPTFARGAQSSTYYQYDSVIRSNGPYLITVRMVSHLPGETNIMKRSAIWNIISKTDTFLEVFSREKLHKKMQNQLFRSK
ncbi:MAG: hypothetical protein CV087_06865 [Candidatus Brocadia sp. WS118]|nr:MAG: hypothetical protein CV087_06865 [Candidatus Brocadia sp. WS118]